MTGPLTSYNWKKKTTRICHESLELAYHLMESMGFLGSSCLKRNVTLPVQWQLSSCESQGSNTDKTQTNLSCHTLSLHTKSWLLLRDDDLCLFSSGYEAWVLANTNSGNTGRKKSPKTFWPWPNLLFHEIEVLTLSFFENKCQTMLIWVITEQ